MNRLFCVAVTGIGLATLASGATMFYTDPASFDAAAAGMTLLGTETFQESNANGNYNLNSPLTYGVPNVDSEGRGFPNGLNFSPITIETGGLAPPILQHVSAGQGYPTKCVGAFFNSDFTVLSLADGGYHAISFMPMSAYTNEWADINAYDGDGVLVGSISMYAPRSLISFCGIVSDTPITRIEVIGQNNGADAIDNISVYVPEPASGVLLALLGVSLMRRR